MTEKRINKTVFSVASLDYLHDISIRLMALFLGHWRRIFGYWHPHTNEKTNIELIPHRPSEMSEDTYFWRTIISEILELEGVTIDMLVETTHVEASFWISSVSKHYGIVMPIAAGKELLLLHERLRPDLHIKEEF